MTHRARRFISAVLIGLASVGFLEAARSFNGSSDFLNVAATPVTAYPLTLAAWFNSSNITVNQHILEVYDTALISGHAIAALGAVAGDPVRARSFQNDLFAQASTTTGYSANTWHHAAGVFTSATDRAAFIDGGSKGTNANNRTPTGLDSVGIGRSFSGGTPAQYFNGLVAEAAIWDVALTDSEILQLARGVSPMMVRPSNIVFYAPLVGRFSPEIEIVGGNNLTVTGAIAADHTRMTYWAFNEAGVRVAGAPAVVRIRRPLVGVGR